ncbi:AAA family ATPase [Actinoplanes sp. NPDC049596]|uniref:AAA family ATPase n=1 Tax=Actinoplanes sp. NPDC049596 TaxID=3154625 RepID=UPI00341240DD
MTGKAVVLVNGLPGAGKTTLSGGLAGVMGLPLISKDAVKDELAGGGGGVADLGVRASRLMWERAAAHDGGVVLESWWFKPRDLAYVEAGLRQCGAGAVVEVWCEVPSEVARRRCAARRRPAYYEDARRLAEHWAEWSAGAEPLGVGTVLRVRTDAAVDVAGVAAGITAGWSSAGTG